MNTFPQRTVGVLGGMGPLATIDFLSKLVNATPATCDQEHIPLIVRFCPEVPDRSEALHGRGPSPEPELTRMAQVLQGAGAECLAIPCNTAHLWHDAIANAVDIPILHIADAALAAVPPGHDERLGLLATSGTLASGLYQQRRRSARWLEPSDDETTQLVMPGIHAVKRGDVVLGARLLEQAAQRLVDRGAQAILMACTEIPVALAAARSIAVPLVDPTDALARRCVAWALTPREAAQQA